MKKTHVAYEPDRVRVRLFPGVGTALAYDDMMRCLVPARLIVILILAGPALAATAPDMEDMLARFKTLEDFIKLIQREYYRPIDSQRLWDGAFQGMLANLDPHSRYLSRDEVLLRNRDPHGRNVGFGFDWQPDPASDRIVVARIVANGPADGTGLAPGDVILAVDGNAVADMNLNAFRRHMIALDGTCTLRVRQVDGHELSVTLERAPYQDAGVVADRLLDRPLGVGYIRISRFVGDTGDRDTTDDQADADARTVTGRAFRATLDRLVANHNLRALVIDLRGNGGGSLKAAVEVADCFLNAAPDGGTLIVAQVSRNPAHQHRYLAHSSNTYPHWPLAVLVDAHTASSAEVLAASLQDHRRAVVVGEATTGKDTIQQQFLLDDESALLLTVARYRPPSGRDLASIGGVQPDVLVPQDPRQRLARARWRQARTTTDSPPPEPPDPTRQRGRDVLAAVVIHTGILP